MSSGCQSATKTKSRFDRPDLVAYKYRFPSESKEQSCAPNKEKPIDTSSSSIFGLMRSLVNCIILLLHKIISSSVGVFSSQG
jgi:hypothetical protein